MGDDNWNDPEFQRSAQEHIKRGRQYAVRRVARDDPEFVAEVLREMGYEVTSP